MNKLTRFVSFSLVWGLLISVPSAVAAGAVKVRLGTLAPKGSSYTKNLEAMGQQWSKAPGGGATLTIYPDGQMGSEDEMVRRMRLGQLQSAIGNISVLL